MVIVINKFIKLFNNKYVYITSRINSDVSLKSKSNITAVNKDANTTDTNSGSSTTSFVPETINFVKSNVFPVK